MKGKIFIGIFPYFNIERGENAYKKRPLLIVGDLISNDYTIIPVSTITKSENIDDEYDIEIDPIKFPLLNLNKKSYIRTHKQTTIYKEALYNEISDLKYNYPELYKKIINKIDKFRRKIVYNS